MTTRPGYVWDATASEWVEIGQAAVVAPIAYQTSEPVSPATGDIWIDSDDEVPSVDSTLYYRWTKTMSGGETSLSGTDDNSLALEYTPGYESVFINGVLQVRGSDYVATDGTTVTGLTALTASDVVMVESIVAYSVGDTYTQSTLNTMFSPITTTGMVLISSTTSSAASTVSFDNVFTSTYSNYMINISGVTSTDNFINMRLRVGGVDSSASNYAYQRDSSFSSTSSLSTNTAQSFWNVSRGNTTGFSSQINVYAPQLAQLKLVNSNGGHQGQFTRVAGANSLTTQFDGFSIYPASGTMTGTIKVYGYK
jgi:hypothetical protein